MARSRVKRFVPFLIPVLAVLLALTTGEIVVRAFKLAPPYRRITVSYEDHESVYRRSDNPILGYELKPNYENPNPDGLFTCRRINAHGQRDVERSVVKPQGVRRVILLGSSQVESTEIPDVNDVMNRQLEDLYSDGKTEVLNFGVGGYCTLAEIELLRVKGLKFDPDIVIVVFSHTDFTDFNTSVVETLAADSGSARVFRELFARWHLFRAILVRCGWTSSGMRYDPVVRNRTAIGDNNVVKGLALLRQLADTHGFRPAVAVWPVFKDDGIQNEAFMPDGRSLIVEELARAVGIPCYRLSSVFRQHYAEGEFESGPRLTYTVGDGTHANETGSTVAALALKEVVAAVSDSAGVVSPVAVPFDAAAVAAAQSFAQNPNSHWKDMSDALAAAAQDHYALRPERSLQHQMDAVRLRPDDPELVSGLAAMQAVRGDLQSALQGFRRAVELAPESAKHKRRLAKCLSMLGRPEEALDLYRELLKVHPGDVEARYDLSRLLQEAGRAAEAIPHYQEVLRLDPDRAEVHNNLGNIILSLGRPAEAMPHYREALRIKPDYAEVYYNLGRASQALGSPQEAIACYRRALRLQPDFADAHYNRGNSLIALGRIEEAMACYREAVRHDPGHVGAHNNLGALYRDSGRLTKAMDHFEQAVRLQPDSTMVRENLRVTREMLKRRTEEDG